MRNSAVPNPGLWHPSVAVLLFASVALLAQEPVPTVPVELADTQITLEIPEDWTEIPPDELEFFSLEAAEQSGGRAAEIYQFGFAPGNARFWFGYPFILIQSKESGRLDLTQFRQLPTVDELRRNPSDSVREAAGELIRNLRVEQLYFDDNAYALNVNSRVEVEKVGLVVVRTASFLTEKGVFVVHCYGRAKHREQTQDLFDSVLASVRLPEGLAYRPLFAEKWPLLASFDWRHWSLLTIILVILGLLAFLLTRQRQACGVSR